MGVVSQVYPLNDEGLDAAVTAVGQGRAIVLPTDTVYGIGADAFSADAVQGLLDAKQRGADKPPPVLIAERSMLRALVSEVPDGAKELATKFWPGPLTLILNEQKALGLHLGETRGTVAVRVPDHDGARELLRRTGPLAVSSANLTGQEVATTCEHARDQLADAVEVYLDDGPTPGNVPSTIVDFASDTDGVVLRLGALSLEQLQEIVPSVRMHEPEPEPDAEPEADVESDADGGTTEDMPAEAASSEESTPDATTTPDEQAAGQETD